MPPRAARAPKKDSVAVAVKKNLSPKPAPRTAKKGTTSTTTTTTAAATAAAAKENASATRTRVTRRKAAVVPQDAPEWQQQALKTAAASDVLQRKTAKGRKPAAKKSPNTAVKKEQKAKGKKSAASSDSDDDDDTASSGASDAESEASAGNARGRGKAKTTTAQRKRAATKKAGADETPTTAKRAPKKKTAEMLCPRCKLHMGRWPFCGLSGEPHVVLEEGEEAAAGESTAASPTTAAE